MNCVIAFKSSVVLAKDKTLYHTLPTFFTAEQLYLLTSHHFVQYSYDVSHIVNYYNFLKDIAHPIQYYLWPRKGYSGIFTTKVILIKLGKANQWYLGLPIRPKLSIVLKPIQTAYQLNDNCKQHWISDISSIHLSTNCTLIVITFYIISIIIVHYCSFLSLLLLLLLLLLFIVVVIVTAFHWVVVFGSQCGFD